MVSTAAAVAAATVVHTALNPVLVTDSSVCILTVIVGPATLLVKGPGMEVPQYFWLEPS